MTEEIINECAFYKDGVCASPINKTCEFCKNIDISKCYYKQLQKVKQEYKKIVEPLRNSYIYSEMCEECKYEEIYHHAHYTDSDVDYMTISILLCRYEYLRNNADRKVYETNIKLAKEDAKIALEVAGKYAQALEKIRALNEPCAECRCHTACGVCSIAESKPYNSFHIANEVLEEWRKN